MHLLFQFETPKHKQKDFIIKSNKKLKNKINKKIEFIKEKITNSEDFPHFKKLILKYDKNNENSNKFTNSNFLTKSSVIHKKKYISTRDIDNKDKSFSFLVLNEF